MTSVSCAETLSTADESRGQPLQEPGARAVGFEGGGTLSKPMRDIVVIDEEKCDGCGACVPACAEGALQIVDGKVKLVSEVYCDGLAACLGECPREAIRIEKREAEQFDEQAAKAHVTGSTPGAECPAVSGRTRSCPGVAMAQGAVPPVGTESVQVAGMGLQNWPIQLGLLVPSAPFLKGAHLLIAADCTGYARGGLGDLAAGRVVIIACPKLDDAQAHIERLAAILSQADVRSITVLRMEVPCCSGLVRIVVEALRQSGKDIPVEVAVVGIDGRIQA